MKKYIKILPILAMVAGISAALAFKHPSKAPENSQQVLRWFTYEGDPNDPTEFDEPGNYELFGTSSPNCPGDGILCAIQAPLGPNNEPINPGEPVDTSEKSQ